MSDPLICLENVSFAYDANRSVLRSVHLKLGVGERLGLVGSNGSGKSTLLRVVIGLLKPTAGRIEVLGKPRVNESDFREVRGQVGLLFQDSDDQIFCPTVEEDVAFGPLNLGMSPEQSRAIVRTTLEDVGLKDFEKRVTYQLSGGEKRLVAMAGVLAMQPRVLLLDEPVAGLDEAAQERITALLETLPHEMIIVSHDPQFLQRVTQSVWRLKDGTLHQINGFGLTA